LKFLRCCPLKEKLDGKGERPCMEKDMRLRGKTFALMLENEPIFSQTGTSNWNSHVSTEEKTPLGGSVERSSSLDSTEPQKRREHR
jgi:hypothetical protein